MRLDQAVDLRLDGRSALRAVMDGVVVWEPGDAGPHFTRDGDELRLHGQAFRVVGWEFWNAAGCHSTVTEQNIRDYFEAVPAGVVTGFRCLPVPAVFPRANIDRMFDLAAEYQRYVMPTLFDGRSWCGYDYRRWGSEQGKGKTRTYYTEAGSEHTFPWIDDIVDAHADNPWVFAWRLINEPGVRQMTEWADTTVDDPDTLPEDIADFIHRNAARIKTHTDHLIVSGTGAGFWLSKSTAPWEGDAQAQMYAVHDHPAVDIVTMEDYEYTSLGTTGRSGWWPSSKAAADALGKPLMVGEIGVQSYANDASNTGGLTTHAQRATIMGQKAAAYDDDDVAAMFWWSWFPHSPFSGYQYETIHGFAMPEWDAWNSEAQAVT